MRPLNRGPSVETIFFQAPQTASFLLNLFKNESLCEEKKNFAYAHVFFLWRWWIQVSGSIKHIVFNKSQNLKMSQFFWHQKFMSWLSTFQFFNQPIRTFNLKCIDKHVISKEVNHVYCPKVLIASLLNLGLIYYFELTFNFYFMSSFTRLQILTEAQFVSQWLIKRWRV